MEAVELEAVEAVVERVHVIDADTHVVEPADIWTARMSRAKWGDQVPHVRWDADAGDEAWFLGDERILSAGQAAMAGWDGYPPDSYPRRLTEVRPELIDASARLKLMDEYGIFAQVLYPNVALFNSGLIMDLKQHDLQLEIARAYNDWQTDWSSVAPDRLLPMTSVPFWDLEASLAEVKRCAEMGHKGIIFTQNPAYFGLPQLDSHHWDPLWATAQEIGLPVNFHVGTSDKSALYELGDPETMGARARYAAATVSFSQTNGRTIAQLIAGGVCQRFPELNFVTVESGVGWIPYLLAYLDWQFLNVNVREQSPHLELLPSEYFKRQIYGCFWFEEATARAAIDIVGDRNFLYMTDFPHPTSMSPGPASVAVTPTEYMATVLAGLPTQSVERVLHDNAARIYHLA
jgi:predicted TIM-barrel fold metal-dependent hydrolase